MTAIEKALVGYRSTVSKIHKNLLEKNIGPSALVPSTNAFSTPFQVGKHKKQYALYEGWVYSAIHTLASKGASQEINLGRLKGGEEKVDEEERRSVSRTKATMMLRKKLPPHAVKRVGEAEFETIFAHPLLDLIEQPNEIQNRWQFVYNFIANINLTGIAFIAGGQTKEGWRLYSLPTSWVRIDHSKGPFAEFYIVNPRDPHNDVSKKPLTRDNIAMAMLPNPGDPLGFLSPIMSQHRAVEIDQYIQTSQVQFFENGIFPSVIIEIGKDPHPDVAGGEGIRPRLTGEQREAVVTAIQGTMSGVYNSGNPAIVDGLIESITKFSNTEQEMGWQKSEKAMRTRILSAFGVHPFILGEEMAGSYAQAYVVQEQFAGRVNVFLDMLGNVLSNFVGGRTGERLFYWFTPAEAKDPALHAQNLREARKLNDITQDEYRAELGFPPLEEEDREKRGKLLDNPSAMQGALAICAAAKKGEMPREGAVVMLARFLNIAEEEAELMVPEYEEPEPVPAALLPFNQQPPNGEQEEEEEEMDSEELNDDALEEAVRAARRILDLTPKATASLIDAASTYRD